MLKHTGGSKCCPHYSNPTMHAVLSHFKTENKSISVKQLIWSGDIVKEFNILGWFVRGVLSARVRWAKEFS